MTMTVKKVVTMITDGTILRAEAGPQALAPPPTAHCVQKIFTLTVAIDTLGGYKWRHCSNL